MVEDYGQGLALIRYHAWWPSSGDPYYQYNVSQNTARINYYGADYTPHLWLDGNVNAGGDETTWNGRISSESRVDSPMDIEVRGNYDPSTRHVNLIVTVIATDQISYSNLKLRIALVESNIGWQAPNGVYWHNQTFRNMYPSTSGVPFSIAEGQSYTYEYSFNINSSLNANNCSIIAFVQSDSGHRILQGGKTDVSELAEPFTLLPFSLLLPPDGAVIDTCYPEFVWQSTTEPGSEDPVSYYVYVSQDPGFPSPFISPAVAETTWTSEICLVPNVVYYWKVLASNGSAPDRFSEEVFSLSVTEPQDIPTLSEWGMILLGLLIAAFCSAAVIAGRKRSAPDSA